MPLKGEVGGSALNSHGNYIADHGKSWINHGIAFLKFHGNPVIHVTQFYCIKVNESFVYCSQKGQNTLPTSVVC